MSNAATLPVTDAARENPASRFTLVWSAAAVEYFFFDEFNARFNYVAVGRRSGSGA